MQKTTTTEHLSVAKPNPENPNELNLLLRTKLSNCRRLPYKSYIKRSELTKNSCKLKNLIQTSTKGWLEDANLDEVILILLNIYTKRDSGRHSQFHNFFL